MSSNTQMAAGTNSVKSRVKLRELSRRIPIILLLFSAFLNVLLARNIVDLKAALLSLKAEMRSMHEFKLGESVPPIQAKDLDGHPVTVDYPENGPVTIYYIFSPDCAWCTRNLQNVMALAEQANHNYRLIGLSLSKNKLRDYVVEHKLTFPVYSELSAESMSAYKMGGTPRTLVVSSDGKLLKNWFGAYGGEVK